MSKDKTLGGGVATSAGRLGRQPSGGEELRSENLSQNSVHMNTQAEEFREHLFGICYSKLPLSRRQCSEMETQVNRANTSQNATPVCIYYVTRSIGQAFGGGAVPFDLQIRFYLV